MPLGAGQGACGPFSYWAWGSKQTWPSFLLHLPSFPFLALMQSGLYTGEGLVLNYIHKDLECVKQKAS